MLKLQFLKLQQQPIIVKFFAVSLIIVLLKPEQFVIVQPIKQQRQFLFVLAFQLQFEQRIGISQFKLKFQQPVGIV